MTWLRLRIFINFVKFREISCHQSECNVNCVSNVLNYEMQLWRGTSMYKNDKTTYWSSAPSLSRLSMV
jgi:hypothetical protein